MDGIGEIDRGRAARQGDQIALWREGENLVLEHLELGVLEKLLRSGCVIQDVEELAQPAILASVGAILLLLVDPMRGDAELGHLVHVRGADLHLDALAFRPEDAGVQRAVVIRLRRRDVIFEAAGNDVIGRVNDAERVIAFADAVDEHAEGHDIGELLERDVLALHLAPDRIRRLLTARYRGVEPAFLQLAAELGDDARHDVAAAIAQKAKPRHDAGAGIGIKLGEGKVFELILHAVHADPLGQWRVDVHRLARDAPPLVLAFDEVQRLHVVQTVGELDQEDANVFRHCEDKLAEILRLLGLVGLQFDA